MTPIVTTKQRIQDGIRHLAKASDLFFANTYDSETGNTNPIDTDAPVQPTNCRCNEIQGAFDIDHHHGMRQIGVRTRWMFQLLLEFPVEVTAEFFEQSFLTNIIHLPRDHSNGPDIQLTLSASAPEHPPQQNAPGGSKIKLAFLATLSRM